METRNEDYYSFEVVKLIFSVIIIGLIISIGIKIVKIEKTVGDLMKNQNTTVDISYNTNNDESIDTITDNTHRTSVDTTDVIYKPITTYKTCNYKNKHPYTTDDDLVEFGCPVCGYQLWCFDSAGSAASAELRCTKCDWHSKQVYIKHCCNSYVAKDRLLDLYSAGVLTEDVEYEY